MALSMLRHVYYQAPGCAEPRHQRAMPGYASRRPPGQTIRATGQHRQSSAHPLQAPHLTVAHTGTQAPGRCESALRPCSGGVAAAAEALDELEA